MPATFEQRLQKRLIRVVEDSKSTTSEILEAARYLIQIKAGKPVRKPQTKGKPTADVTSLLGTRKP